MGEGIKCTQENPCTAMQLAMLEINNIKEVVAELKDIVKKLQNNLPPYMSVIAWACGLAFGIMGTLLAVK